MQLRPWLRLVRFPAVFTAIGDPVAGWALASDGAPSLADPGWVAPALAGAAIYAGGMALNDYADRERDRARNPRRPIPAGEIRPAAALAGGVLLLAVGASLGFLASTRAAGVAALLVLGVLAYDFALKRWLIPGALAMGALRAGNVILGAAANPSPAWPREAALGLGLFVFVLTLASRFEDATTTRRGVHATAVAHFAALAGVAWLCRGPLPLAAVAFVALGLGEAYLRLAIRRDRSVAARLVRRAVLSIPLVDAAFVLEAGYVAWGAGLVVLPVLSFAVGRLGSVSGLATETRGEGSR